MAELIGIAGNSGSGKTTSVKDLNPKETFIISVLGKPLPFRGFKKNYPPLKIVDKSYIGNFFTSNKVDNIIKIFGIINKSRPEIKQIVIDDANYLMSCETMDRAEEKGYEKFTQIAKHYYDMLKTALNLRDDLKVIVISHIENAGDTMNPQYKLKTTGKMLDNTINVDGLFTYLLYTELVESENGDIEHVFRTNTIKGEDTCKTPLGCFKELYIPNNLQLVVETIDRYNNGDEETEDDTENKTSNTVNNE
jgi:hypothetical protein